MEFNEGDKVRVIYPSTNKGRTGRITNPLGGGEVYSGVYIVLLDGDENPTGWFASELELVDKKRETLLGLAEKLAEALATENVMDNPASISGVYENITRALVETLCVLTNRFEVGDIYDRILCGSSVRDAVAAEVK